MEEKHSSATHVVVLQNLQKVGEEHAFGCKPVFIKEQVRECLHCSVHSSILCVLQGVMLALDDTPHSSAYQSRVTNDDIIMMYATVDNTKRKIGTLKSPLSKKQPEGEEIKDFESDMKIAAWEENSMILVLKRLPKY